MIHLVVILLYLFTLIGIGMYKAGKIKTQSDFAVAGRSLTPWVLVGTMLATWMGTGSILGNAGKTYDTGMAALILPLGSILGIVLLTKIAGKVRAFEKFTVPEILGDRFGPGARMLSVIALVIAYMVIVSYQFNAGGAVLNTVLMDETGNSLISIQTGTIIAAIFIILIMGDANMYQRFFASKNAKGAEQATKVLIFAVLLAELMIIFSAWVVSSMIPDAEVGKYVLIYAAHKLLPTFLGAIMMTTIVGIIISTADSFLLVPATTLMRDVYLNYINPKANEKKIVLLSRVLVLGLGIIAYIVSLGFAKSSGFFERALYAYTIYGAAITPSLVAALFWKRATKEGAVVSILTGTVTTLLWKEAAFIQNIIPQNIYNNMDEVLPAITLSVVSLVVVSLLTKKN